MDPVNWKNHFEKIRIKTTRLCLEGKADDAGMVWQCFLQAVVFRDSWESVRTYSEACIQQVPNHPAGYFAAGLVCMHSADYPGAATRFTKVLELDPSNTGALKLKGEAFVMMEKYDEAVECAEALLRSDPGSLEYHRLCVSASMMMDDHVASLERINLALLYHPDSPYLHIDKASCLDLLGCTDEAMEEFGVAEKQLAGTRLDTESVSRLSLLYLNRGGLRKRLHDHPGGEDEYDMGFVLMEMTKSMVFENRSN